MKIKHLMVVAGLLALLSAGCSQQPSGPATAGKKRIGVTLLTREHQFYRDLEEGLQTAAKERGYELIIQSGDFDLARQQSQIENFITQKVDAIIVCAADSKGVGPALALANAANIPVFTADIKAQGGKIVSHVASNNVQGGRLAAEYIAKLLKDTGEVGIIGQPEVQSTIDREAGFREEIGKHPNLKIAASVNGKGRRDDALKAAEDLLQGNPNLKAIFAINDDSALGALSAAEARGRKDLIIVGYDATPEAVKAIKAGGAFKADVAQLPKEMGAKTIAVINDLFNGQTPGAEIAIPVKLVDASNAP